MCNLVITFVFILYMISKVRIRKTKFLRDYDFNQKFIIGLGISVIFLSIVTLPITAALLHSVIFEPLYLILDIIVGCKIIVKLHDEEMAVLYGNAYQNNRVGKMNKVTDWISTNIIVLRAILFIIKVYFRG